MTASFTLISIVLIILADFEAIASQRCVSSSPTLLRITLRAMLPWIMVWIAIAGIARLFSDGHSRGPERGRREPRDEDSDYDDI